MQSSKEDLGSLLKEIENSLFREGEKRVPDVRERLERATANASIDDSDDELFQKLVLVVFYSGFRAATVTAKKAVILRHLGDWRRVKDYGAGDIDRVLADPEMIAMRAKVEACIHNAKEVAALVKDHRSFASYLHSRETDDPVLVAEDLKGRFKYLGTITVYHFMMMIGFDVLKPDRVIMRVLHRLGLVEDRDRAQRAIQIGRDMAEATGVKIRRVDRVLVAFGQVATTEFGIERGICLEDKPRCEACGVTARCRWYRERSPLGARSAGEQ